GEGYVFAADRSHSTVNVIDPKLHKVVASATLEMEPDIVRYVPATHEVWVTEEDPQKGQVEILTFSVSGTVHLSHAADVKVAGGACGGPGPVAGLHEPRGPEGHRSDRYRLAPNRGGVEERHRRCFKRSRAG